MIKCTTCGGCGWIYIQHIETITHSMAIDAGYPEMEGQKWDFGEKCITCPDCDGTGEIMEEE